eukprot:jgi/Ulvmu1/6100/UM027_0078.1
MMLTSASQTWDTIIKLHRLVSRSRSTGEREPAVEGLEQAIDQLLHQDNLNSFILTERGNHVVYAIENLLPHVEPGEIVPTMIRRSLYALERMDDAWSLEHCSSALAHCSHSLRPVDVSIGMVAVKITVEHLHMRIHGEPARFPCCCHQAGNACQVIHAFGQSLKSSNQTAHHLFLWHLLEYPEEPSALYPSTSSSRLLTLCQSLLKTQAPCYIFHSASPRPAHQGSGSAMNRSFASHLSRMPNSHLPSMASLSAVAQLVSGAMLAAPTACLELMDTCCSFIEQEYLGGVVVRCGAHRAPYIGHKSLNHATSWKVGLESRGSSAQECHQLVATLLGGILDAFNTHFPELLDSPLATRGPELCFKLLSGMEHHAAQGWAPRAVAVRGLAVLVWRHRMLLLSAPHLQAASLHSRILHCLQRARDVATTGTEAFVIRSVVGHLERKLQATGGLPGAADACARAPV